MKLARARLGLQDGGEAGGSGPSEAETASLPVKPGQPLKKLAKPNREVALFPVGPDEDNSFHRQVKVLVHNRSRMTVLVEGTWVRQVVVTSGSQQKTAKGIGIGPAEDQVRASYGDPERVEEGTSGRYPIYNSLGLAFAIWDGKVVAGFTFQ